MLPRRFIQSLNSLSKRSSRRLNGSRKLSTNNQQSNLNKFGLLLVNSASNRGVPTNKNNHCSVCCNDSQARYYRTDTTGSDNIVTSPHSDVSFPDCLLHEFIWENVNHFPDLIGMECSSTGRKYTFAQLRDRSRKFAAALLKSGFKPGQVISIILPNIPEFPIAIFGAFEAGIVVSTVNPAYTAEELYHQFKDSNTTCVITYADKLSAVQQVKERLGKESKGATQLKIISIQDYDGKLRPYPEGVWSLKEMFDNNNVDTSVLNSISTEYNITSDNLAVLPYSSGTTGLPKGVCLTHHNLISNISQIEHKETRQIKLAEGDFQDILPAVLPFFHIYGLNLMLMQAPRNGAKLVTLSKFEPDLFLKVLQDHKCSIAFIVPPIVLFLANHSAVTKQHLQYMRFVVSGAAPIGGSDIERCLYKMPDETCLLQGYGMTETSPLALVPRNKKSDNYSTVGKPVSLTRAKITDENGRALGVGEKGELCIQGPQVMKGYLNKPKDTADTLKDGWLHTGDIGYYDENSDFYIVDRKKELIKVKGFQVAPAELEELIRNHPLVADVAVIGIPDERSGEVPIAYVVPKQGQENIPEDAIKDFISDKVAHYKQLSHVILTKSIPKSAAGKILRRQLKDLYSQSSKNQSQKSASKKK